MSFSTPAITGHIVVNDAVHDRVQDRHRAPAQQVGAGLEAVPDSGQIGVAPSWTVIKKSWSGKDVYLTEFDGLRSR